MSLATTPRHLGLYAPACTPLPPRGPGAGRSPGTGAVDDEPAWQTSGRAAMELWTDQLAEEGAGRVGSFATAVALRCTGRRSLGADEALLDAGLESDALAQFAEAHSSPPPAALHHLHTATTTSAQPRALPS